jgi:hypothetical protein
LLSEYTDKKDRLSSQENRLWDLDNLPDRLLVEPEQQLHYKLKE